MKSFLKLFNFEFNRFFKLYIGIFVCMFVFQIGGAIVSSLLYKKQINELVNQGAGQNAITEQMEPFGLLDVTYNLYFLGPLFIGLISILFYTFFIWYRDWIGKNTFIYRLLTLPTSRMNVFYAKLATIFITGLGLMAFQLFLMAIQSKVIAFIIPKIYRSELDLMSVVYQLDITYMLLPTDFTEFIFYQFIGIVVTVVFFTSILIERSYRIIGNVYALLNIGIACLIMLAPLWSLTFIGYNYFYGKEVILLVLLSSSIVLILSLVLSRYLINKKVTV